MKNKPKNDAEKYLMQKNNYPIEYGCIALTIIGLIVIFFTHFGYFGIPFALIGAVGLVIIYSWKIKEEDFDAIPDAVLKANGYKFECKDVLRCYDLTEGMIKKGKDGKPRSEHFAVTDFYFNDASCRIVVHRINTIDETDEKMQFYVNKGCKTEIIEKVSEVDPKLKTRYLILNDETEHPIPVDVTQYDTDVIIEKIKG